MSAVETEPSSFFLLGLASQHLSLSKAGEEGYASTSAYLLSVLTREAQHMGSIRFAFKLKVLAVEKRS